MKGIKPIWRSNLRTIRTSYISGLLLCSIHLLWFRRRRFRLIPKLRTHNRFTKTSFTRSNVTTIFTLIIVIDRFKCFFISTLVYSMWPFQRELLSFLYVLWIWASFLLHCVLNILIWLLSGDLGNVWKYLTSCGAFT